MRSPIRNNEVLRHDRLGHESPQHSPLSDLPLRTTVQKPQTTVSS